MVALHAGLVTLEVAGMFIFWHFAEQAEHENEVLARQAGEARREVERAEQESRERAAEGVAPAVRGDGDVGAGGQSGDLRDRGGDRGRGADVRVHHRAVDDIHELQLNITSSVEEQASVLAEVITQLSAATAAADQVLAGLQTLSASTGR
jgi:hypothetical protein